ncbi:hypothetical protein [Archaeoglobus fulgidus]|uniref:hypothetical protein n=1 Tax=Archaeoglobus fulgidus TaxID=2234 RepID=UPI00064EFB65|nr:hypothetical protein [Archaeoglobus fulgidus]
MILVINPALADLPRAYQSDDVDISGTTNSTDINEIAKYTDIVFLKYPSAVSEQNRKFISSFPSTSDYECVVPEGVPTKSGSVIRDVYIKLIPISGLVRTPLGKYYADDEVVVGYVADYRIVLPPDDDEGDVRYYYSLKGTSITVSVDGRTGNGKKDVLTLKPSRDIRAVALITAVVNVRKEVDVEVTVNGTTYIETYVYNYTKKYSLSVEDVIPVVPHRQSVDVYELRDENGTIEYWILLHSGVSEIRSNDTVVVGGLSSFITYRSIKSAVKVGEGFKAQISLSEPAYEVVVLPSYELYSHAAVLDKDSVKADVKLGDNIKLGNLYEIKAIRVGFDKDIEVVDVFGKTLPQKRYVKYYLKPNVSIRVEKTEKSYKVWMNVSANSTPYNGPVYLSIGSQSLTLNATNGVVYFKTERGYKKIGYLIPSTLPDNWHESGGTVFFKSISGSFTLGKPDPLLSSIYKLIFWVVVVLPFILLYLLAKWLLCEEEEDVI